MTSSTCHHHHISPHFWSISQIYPSKSTKSGQQNRAAHCNRGLAWWHVAHKDTEATNTKPPSRTARAAQTISVRSGTRYGHPKDKIRRYLHVPEEESPPKKATVENLVLDTKVPTAPKADAAQVPAPRVSIYIQGISSKTKKQTCPKSRSQPTKPMPRPIKSSKKYLWDISSTI